MKKIILNIIMFLFLLPINVLATTNNTSIINNQDYYSNINKEKKLYDYADLYTTEEEKVINSKIEKLINKYKTEVIVMTSNYNHSYYDTRDLAADFYDNNNFGYDKDGTGTILVIDMYSRNYYILTTGNTLKIINDYRVENILDDMENNMIDGNYYNATLSFLKGVNKYESYHKYGPPFLWIGALILAFILAISSLLKERKKLKMIKDSMDASYYFIDNIIDLQEDNLVDVKKRRIIHSSSSSSGGRSRGGFSSGGRSHGGGGRRF